MKAGKLLTLLAAAATVSAIVGFGSGRGAKVTMVHGVAWRASFQDALAEAKKTGKPILLLSMFGKLDEEMACANARTLRATLFKDPEFQKLITTEVIPAWEMVRAVPKIEIDLGDGKRIRRTVRGNAVMYLCNPDGLVIDAYPGVYTAADFMPMVRESLALTHADAKAVLAYHAANATDIPLAGATMGKMAMESPTLDLMGARPTEGAPIVEVSTDPARQRFLRSAARLKDLSLTPMRAPDTVYVATGHGLTGRDPNEVAMEIVRNDSKNNITRVRAVIHLWLASEKRLPTTMEARDTVLATILKIPYKDPYFGLKDILIPGTPE